MLAAEVDAAMRPALPRVQERGLVDSVLDQRIMWQETGASPARAMDLPALFAVVRLIASTIDQLDVQVRGTSDPSWLYFPRREGGHLDLGDLIQHVVTSQALHGAGYLQIVKKSDKTWKLDALHPDSVQVIASTAGVVRLEYRVNGQAMERLPAVADDQKILRPYLLPIPYLVTPQHPEGTSPVKDTWHSIAGYLKVEEQAANLLDSGTYSGGRLETDSEITPESARRFRDAWVDARNSGRIPVLGNGIRYVNDIIEPDKAQWIESRLANAQTIASMFGVPPDMLGLTMQGGASSLSYANAQDNNRRFRANCLEAFTSQIEDAMPLLLGPGRTYAESRNFTFDWTSWEGAANADTADPAGPVADPAG